MKNTIEDAIFEACNSTIDFCNNKLREIFLPFSETSEELESFIYATLKTVANAPNDINNAVTVWKEYAKGAK